MVCCQKCHFFWQDVLSLRRTKVKKHTANAFMNRDELIRDIAERLDLGERVFLNRETSALLSYPDPERNDFEDAGYLMDEVLDIVEEALEQYIEFPPPTSRESYLIMEDFMCALPDPIQQKNLSFALNSGKPFRNFRRALEQDGLEDEWQAYKAKRLAEYVVNIWDETEMDLSGESADHE